MKSSRVVFCDFDGTITAKDTFVSVLEKFAPDVSARLLPIIYSRQITLKQGIQQILASVSAKYYSQIIEHTANQLIRPGLEEFLVFLNQIEVPLVLISGGLTDMVKVVLERQHLMNYVTAIYAGEVDTQGEYLRFYSTIESDTELVAKVKAMAKYPATEKIAIGDSVTDINMSLAADLVFARDLA